MRKERNTEKYRLIKASAGSGKTYTIAKEYIEFILQNPDEIKNILAITFTNKAAFEMKERILEFLKGLAGFDELVNEKRRNSIQQLKEEIKTKLKFTDEEIKEKSKECLERILYSKNGNGFSDFSVMTIDSFTNRLVKVFSEDLNISPSYEISFNVKNVIKKYIDVLISKVSDENEKGKKLKDIFLDYLYLRSDEEKSLNVEREVYDTTKSIREREKNFDESIEVNEYDRKNKENILQNIKNFELNFVQHCNKEEIKNLDIELFKGKSRSVVAYIKNFSDRNSKSENSPNFFELFIDLISKTSFNDFYKNEFSFDDLLNKSKEQKSKIENFKKSEEYKRLEEEISSFHSFLRKNLVKYFENKIYLKNIYSNLIYERITNLIEEYQKKNEIVFIDELNKKVKELFKDENDIPFIYFKIGEKFKKFLIDEFQDTSSVQWNNLKPLIENGIAEGYNCTLVGDDKQAIYRFRGGSTDVIKEFEKNENVEKIQLTKNWRSEKEIVEFNNCFFANIDQDIFKDDQIYKEENVVQGSKSQNCCGYVEINIIEKDLKKEILENGKLVEIITDCLKRGFKQLSISILVRTSAEGSKIAEVLTGLEIENQRIKIVSADTLFIENNPYVVFIISLLKFSMFNTLEDFANLLYSWKDMDVKDSKFKEAEKIFLGQIKDNNKKLNCSEVLRILWGENILENYYEKIKKSVNFSTPYEIVSKIIEHIINPNCNDYTGSVSYIVKLLDESCKFGKEGSVIDFLEYYDENKDDLKISSPSEQDAITISTIHKSKGLEYDVVIVPFATWNGRRKISNSFLIESINGEKISFSYGDIKEEYLDEKNPLKKTKEQELKNIFYDDLNLLYVAFTRAKKELYIFTEKKKDSKNKKDEDQIPTIIELINKKCFEEEFINCKYSESQVKFGKKFSCLNDTRNNQNEDKQKIEIISKLNLCSHEQHLFLDRSLKRILNIEKENEKIKRGDVLHKLLSLIYTENDIEKALNFGLVEGFFSINEKKTYENLLKNIIKDSILSKFFKQELKVFNEKDICFEGKILRPDRIVFDGNNCYIVDYKTGLEQKSHVEQIKEYMRFFKNKNFEIKGFLVYVDSMKTIEVEYEVS
ncbi:MAG: UvrD-helicase domain-containing protein [candidate division WOR-3 bacterium]